MLTAEAIVQGHQSRESYRDSDGKPNYVEWAKEHPRTNELLNRAMLEAEKDGENGG